MNVKRTLLIAAAGALPLVVLTHVSRGQSGPVPDPEMEYAAHWRSATNAVVSFATAELALSVDSARPQRSMLANEYQREHDNLSREIVWLGRSNPPSSELMRHWKFVTVYEQILSAMTVVTDALERDDAPARDAGLAAFRDGLVRLRDTAEEVARANE
jgi:hypothetical protein